MELGEIHKRVSVDKEGAPGQNLEHSSIRSNGKQKNKQRKPRRATLSTTDSDGKIAVVIVSPRNA